MNPSTIRASHTPAARKKANATAAISRAFAARYDASASEYATGAALVKFMKRHAIALDDVPLALRKRIGKRNMDKLKGGDVKGKTNGHGREPGVGIPLEAIPARPERKPGSGNYPRTNGKGHPNAPQIDKILELLARPDLAEPVAEHLLAALDKLIGP